MMTVVPVILCLSIFATSVAFGFAQRQHSAHLQAINGILNVYKPRGITSHDACQIVKRIVVNGLKERCALPSTPKIKVGHGGTLDMTAEGVLAIGIGRGTKLLSSYLKGNKKYEATGVLGYETDTLDIHGNTLKEAPWEHVTDEAFDEAMSSMKGEYDQIPPLYSSKKYNGKRLRDYAIKNISVDVKPAKIIVHSIERIRTPGEELPKFGLTVSCSGGTYVRSIIRDIAYKLGTLGTMRSLVRTFKHNLSVDNSINVETIDYETIVQNIITPNAM